VFDINDGLEAGKEQLDFRLRPEARHLGVSELELGRQIRGAFFGAEASRQQRGRDELRVYVRLPREERHSEHALETLLLRTPGAGEIPLGQAVRIERGRSFTEIRRENGRRAVEVSADVDRDFATVGQVMGLLQAGVMPELRAEIPGLAFEVAGEEEDRMEAMQSLRLGFGLAVLGMFATMAMAFRSYLQPLLLMVAIPFGLVGAVFGHLIMGHDLSLVSMFGLVALSGVVVNDSLVLIYAVNDQRSRGRELMDALVLGAARRFRPILLTSLTTFFGLAPMIFETSLQARFLIPMAVSLGFGVLFVTVITLVIIPASYMVLEDFKAFLARARARWSASGVEG
jgi:multidrug efflux pump subunit AcrB